jgi:hypothetical protein
MGTDYVTGSIEVGKSADFVVLDRNPLRVPVEDLAATSAVSTWFAGAAGVPAVSSAQPSPMAPGQQPGATCPAPDRPSLGGLVRHREKAASSSCPTRWRRHEYVLIEVLLREVAEPGAVDEFDSAVLGRLGPACAGEPGRGDQDSATCTLLIHRTHEFPDVVHAEHARVLLRLHDRQAADHRVAVDHDTVDAVVAGPFGRPPLQAAGLEELADEMLELRGRHGSEIGAGVKAGDHVDALDEGVPRQVEVPDGGDGFDEVRVVGDQCVEMVEASLGGDAAQVQFELVFFRLIASIGIT